MTSIISVSELAEKYIKNKLQASGKIGFRLSVKKTGCSGYSYAPTLIEKIIETDVSVETKNGLKIYVDATWLHLLEGVNIDYQEEEKTGLKQKRLVFTNPHESSRCGCGESFHIEEE